jgi:hypothetical protein
MLALFAVVNALEALRYLLPHVPFPVDMENFRERRGALSLHALGGAIALLTGPLQFVPSFRESSWNRIEFCKNKPHAHSVPIRLSPLRIVQNTHRGNCLPDGVYSCKGQRFQ